MPKIEKIITLAVTGGYGSGKSTVTAYFRKLGAFTLDCDQIAKELTKNGRLSILQTIRKAFGQQVITKEGNLDRARLAQIVFSDSKKRIILEAILHPAIRQEVIRRLKQSHEPIRVVEVPLLFEAKGTRALKPWLNQFDASIVIYAKGDAVARRLKNKGVSLREFKDRSRNQIPIEVKCRRADFVVDNSRSHQKLRKQIQQIYRACQFALGLTLQI